MTQDEYLKHEIASGVVVEIPLTQRLVALVDKNDYELVKEYSWQAHKRNNTWYAVSGSPYSLVYMHRLILGLKTGDEREADHKNSNGLDNRRSNIRIATRSQNSANKPKRDGDYSSTHKGVYFAKDRNKWRASITVDYKTIRLGSFDTEIEAAQAYDTAAKEHFGEFAQSNTY